MKKPFNGKMMGKIVYRRRALPVKEKAGGAFEQTGLPCKRRKIGVLSLIFK